MAIPEGLSAVVPFGTWSASDFDEASKLHTGADTPKPKDPTPAILAFSDPSSVNLTWPSVPVSTVSTSVFPSNILSAANPVNCEPSPINCVAVTIPA